MATRGPFPPMRTPWGKQQTCDRHGDRIYFVTTAGHGGYWLGPEPRRVIRERFGRAPWLGGYTWWEEDVDSQIVEVMLFDMLDADKRDRVFHLLQRNGALEYLLDYLNARVSLSGVYALNVAWKELADWHAKRPKGAP